MNYKDSNRYAVHSDEDFESGSKGQVLKNYLGVKTKNEIEQIEAQELDRVELEIMEQFDEDHQFTASDICNIHHSWLGDVYPSAGKYRTVDMSKEGFPFAAAGQIDKLMGKLEIDYLKKYSPCHFKDMDKLAYALGVVHVEFVIIHPFREGNGRTARLLADLMAVQAKRETLNYSSIDQTTNAKGFREYIAAIHAGFENNYAPIQNIFIELLSKSESI